MRQVWEAVNGDIFDTQQECINFERSLFEEKEDSVKKFYTALSLLEEACSQGDCGYCPISSFCNEIKDFTGRWTGFMDENARSILSKEVD